MKKSISRVSVTVPYPGTALDSIWVSIKRGNKETTRLRDISGKRFERISDILYKRTVKEPDHTTICSGHISVTWYLHPEETVIMSPVKY